MAYDDGVSASPGKTSAGGPNKEGNTFCTDRCGDVQDGSGPGDEEYEVVEFELHPANIVCPDCGGITMEGLDFCDKCGGVLN
jgi:hypothetical protein